MTNLTILDLTTLSLKSLQSLAKDLKIKSWWTLKKAELLYILEKEKLNQEAVEKAKGGCQEESKAQEKPTKVRKPRAPKVEKDQENLVTLKELADEFNMKGTKARRLLRNETAARPFGGNRWEWDKNLHKEALEAARSILKAHTK